MAEANRGARPLSPHLQIYNLPLTARMSILHRITGCGLALGGVLVVWWFLAAAAGPEYFAFVDGLLTSWLGGLVLIGLLAAFWYHFCNGVRHLVWDAGYGFDITTLRSAGFGVASAAALLTAITLIVAI